MEGTRDAKEGSFPTLHDQCLIFLSYQRLLGRLTFGTVLDGKDSITIGDK